MVKGLKNAYLMHFPSLHSWFRCSVCFYLKCSSSHNQRVIQRVKNIFLVKIRFKSCIIKNRSQMYTSEKNTKQLTVRWGGSTLTVSLTVKYLLFLLTTSLLFQQNARKTFCPVSFEKSADQLSKRYSRDTVEEGTSLEGDVQL